MARGIWVTARAKMVVVLIARGVYMVFSRCGVVEGV